MGNLKYNPLLKLNLQEESDAEEIIGDGYNEKLLGWEDFLNDCQNITYDTGEIRKYVLTAASRNTTGKNLICNFSFEFFCNNYGIFSNGYTITLNSNVAIFYNNGFYGAGGGEAPFKYNCQVVKFINAKALGINTWLNIDNNNAKNCIFLLLNCNIWAAGNTPYNPINRQIIIYLNCKWTNNIPSNCTFQHPDKFSIICNNNLSNYFNNKSNFNSFVGIDNALDINSPGLLPNSVITAALQELTPDASLDSDSNKPVMNSAVTQEINTITQIIENFQDINVSNLAEFENAIQTGQTTNVRIHLTTDITLTQSVTYNLDKIQIYGHDNKINLQNFTFTIEGETAYFNAVRFNANSSVNATTAANYSNAQINIISTVNSSRYFFEYVIFMNFICKSSDNSTTDYVKTFFDVRNSAGTSYPSLHLYFTFCEIMTNYTQSNINSLCAGINHSGSMHALTVHNIDFWGNNKEANSCPNWTFTGNSLSGLAKLAWISDGSAIYAQRTNSLTPSFVNQYNPSNNEFLTLKNSFTFQTFNDVKVNSYTSSQVQCYTTVYYNNYIAIVKFFTVGSGNIPPGVFTNKIPIKLIDSLQLDNNVQVNVEADGFTLVSLNQTAPNMFGTFTMPILQN